MGLLPHQRRPLQPRRCVGDVRFWLAALGQGCVSHPGGTSGVHDCRRASPVHVPW